MIVVRSSSSLVFPSFCFVFLFLLLGFGYFELCVLRALCFVCCVHCVLCCFVCLLCVHVLNCGVGGPPTRPLDLALPSWRFGFLLTCFSFFMFGFLSCPSSSSLLFCLFPLACYSGFVLILVDGQ